LVHTCGLPLPTLAFFSMPVFPGLLFARDEERFSAIPSPPGALGFFVVLQTEESPGDPFCGLPLYPDCVFVTRPLSRGGVKHKLLVSAAFVSGATLPGPSFSLSLAPYSFFSD